MVRWTFLIATAAVIAGLIVVGLTCCVEAASVDGHSASITLTKSATFQTEQHVPVIDFTIWFADRFQLELSSGLKRLNALSRTFFLVPRFR
jgi:hypothetical protein